MMLLHFELESHVSESYYKQIDHYWREVGTIKNGCGTKNIPQLLALVECILTFSHGNSIAEKGFSINKSLLEKHGSTIDE